MTDVHIYDPAWEYPATWGEKTSSERGLLFVWYNRVINKYHWYEVISTTEAIETPYYPPTITINSPDFPRIPRFNPDPILAKLVYGMLIKNEVNETSVKFGGPMTMANDESGTGIDPTPNGICQVCHENISAWNSSGSGANHFNGWACIACHPFEQGFSSS